MRPAEETKRLIEQAGIKIDPKVRQACLDELTGELEVVRTSCSEMSYRHRWRLAMNCTIGVVAAGIVVFIGVMGFLETREPEPVAFLSDSIDAVWGKMEEVPAKDVVIRQGRFVLTDGFAEITFYDGAVVVVEGPADVELLGGNNMFVKFGKIYAVVPQEAVGFVVETPVASIVDLGTEFGVSVEVDGSCELHVIKGNVSFLTEVAGTRVSQIVRKGEAVSVGIATGGIQNIQPGQSIFVREINGEEGIIRRGESGW